MSIVSKIAYRLRQLRNDAQFLLIQRTGQLSPPGEPEFDAPTLARFREELGKAHAYVEFGSGGSTLLVDAAGIPARAVESDRFYARKVEEALSAGTKVTVAVPDMGLTRTWGRPVFGAHRKGARYVEAGFSGDDALQPDLALVDGRYRVACALEVARRAHEGGYSTVVIFDDYDGRKRYHAVEELLGTPDMAGRAAVFTVGSQTVTRAEVARFCSDQS